MVKKMMDVLAELGISQYLDAFLDQGFDTWDTILDITESDLDALGVKLGHRRKLQRKIANFRGLAPESALLSPSRAGNEEAARPESGTNKHDASNHPAEGRGPVPGVLAKRKYRRHPKPDECAPERPPSAYVLFSNKMREKLRGQNLSFTDIAKLVGEKWQTLTPAERKPYENEAQAAKDKYNSAMVSYKKTPEYQRYILYLQEFKARHSNQTQGVSFFFPATDKDAFKRIKLAEFSSTSSQQSTMSASPPASSQPPRQRDRSDTTSGSVSSSDGQHERDTEHPHSPHEGRYSSASPTPGPHDAMVDDQGHSPHVHHGADGHGDWSPRPMSMSPQEGVSGPLPSRKAGWAIEAPPPPLQPQQRSSSRVMGDASVGGSQVNLPSLSDMFDKRQLSAGPASPIPPSGLVGGVGGGAESRTSMLRHDQMSSGASTSSVSSGSGNYPRTPMDGSLPIHALLSGKPPPPSPPPPPPLSHQHHHRHASSSQSHSGRIVSSSPQMQTRGDPSPTLSYSPPPRPYVSMVDGRQPLYKEHGVSGMAHANGGGYLSSPLSATTDDALAAMAGLTGAMTGPAVSCCRKQSNLDGMSALLEAGEIVDRRA